MQQRRRRAAILYALHTPRATKSTTISRQITHVEMMRAADYYAATSTRLGPTVTYTDTNTTTLSSFALAPQE